MPNTVGPNSQ